jgi:hypothetical protein
VDEIASLAVSAVGACARKPLTARASLFFSLPSQPLEELTDSLLARVETLRGQGFRACDAAITERDESGTRGFLIGEHSGTREMAPSPRVILEPASGLTTTLRAFPPVDP